MQDITIEEAKSKVESALATLYIEDFDLLVRDVNERSISHKLAEYLQSEFNQLGIKGLKVDCEYNRHEDRDKRLGDDKKMLELLQQKYNAEQLTKKLDDTNAITVYPDIIVHVRGIDDYNLLVIEIKKSTNTDQWQREFDIVKLKAFTKKSYEQPHTSYHYNYGLFLDIPTGEVVNSLDQWMNDCLKGSQWFVNG